MPKTRVFTGVLQIEGDVCHLWRMRIGRESIFWNDHTGAPFFGGFAAATHILRDVKGKKHGELVSIRGTRHMSENGFIINLVLDQAASPLGGT